jgi:hypothetical protein
MMAVESKRCGSSIVRILFSHQWIRIAIQNVFIIANIASCRINHRNYSIMTYLLVRPDLTPGIQSRYCNSLLTSKHRMVIGDTGNNHSLGPVRFLLQSSNEEGRVGNHVEPCASRVLLSLWLILLVDFLIFFEWITGTKPAHWIQVTENQAGNREFVCLLELCRVRVHVSNSLGRIHTEKWQRLQ